ncbi:hypothetical protein AaE_011393 [Aphanomyces astaci]|uniref:Uncharacterized protein n=1 Tax=Aphanomyces astaci TaxID=112090 RepID=A0A6A4ZS47_APHAT|nr:hypothetical protein AaE_011393 [Aphanomyces astaci]
MDRARKAQPHANEAIWTREVSRQLENHLTRINHAQPSIDTSVPKTAANVSTGSKKNQLKEDRLDAIEIENRRLLDRIASIALSTTKDSVDAPSNHPTVKKSLHEGQRKREQQKIWLENQVSVIVHLKANKSSGIAETIAIGQVDYETSERRKGRKMGTPKLKFVKSKEHKLTAQDTIDHQHDSTADDDHAAKTAKPRHCKKGGKPSNKVFIDVSTYRPHSVTDVTAPTFVKLPPLQCDPPVTNDITSNDRPVPQPTDDELLPTSQPHNGAAYTLPSIVLTKDGVSSAPGSSPAPWSPLSAIDSPPVPPMSSYNDDESDAALLLPLVSTDPKEDWVTVVTTSAPMGCSREGSAAEYLLEETPSVEAQPLLSTKRRHLSLGYSKQVTLQLTQPPVVSSRHNLRVSPTMIWALTIPTQLNMAPTRTNWTIRLGLAQKIQAARPIQAWNPHAILPKTPLPVKTCMEIKLMPWLKELLPIQVQLAMVRIQATFQAENESFQPTP